MNTHALLRALQASGVVLQIRGDRLHVDAPSGALTDAMRQALVHHKETLLTMLEAYEERAALAEYCGGLARADAEHLAWQIVLKEHTPITKESHYAHDCPSPADAGTAHA